MKLTNEQIYNTINSYKQEFADYKSYIPAKINFAIQKNIQQLMSIAENVEKTRMEVAQHYGTLDETGQIYNFSNEVLSQVQKELAELYAIEQDIDIKTFNIDELGSVEFTPAQMQVIMFMIED